MTDWHEAGALRHESGMFQPAAPAVSAETRVDRGPCSYA